MGVGGNPPPPPPSRCSDVHFSISDILSFCAPPRSIAVCATCDAPVRVDLTLLLDDGSRVGFRSFVYFNQKETMENMRKMRQFSFRRGVVCC
jgi:hypothetical protein